jgi:short-subunit dehydrogenase
MHESIKFWAGKRVWVVGGSSGIGRAVAELIAARGATTIVSSRSGKLLSELVAEQNSLGNVAHAVPLNVANDDSVRQAITRIEGLTGGIDTLIYSAGAWTPVDLPNINMESVEEQTQVNHLGLVRCVRSVVPGMFERGTGTIVGITSASAFAPLPRAEAYGASKAAANYFLESLRIDAKKLGIGVVSVTPGFVDTPLTRRNDFKMPFLLSATAAAHTIVRGIEKGKAEISPPLRLTVPLRLLGALPRSIQQPLIAAIFHR